MCQIFGLAPYSMNKTSRKWELIPLLKILSIIFIVCIVLVFLSFFIFMNFYIVNLKGSMVYIILNVVTMILTQLHAMLVLLELYLKRNEQVNLLNLMEELNFLFVNNLKMHIDYSKMKLTVVKLIIFWIFEMTIIIPDIIVYIQRGNIYEYNIYDSYHLIYDPPYLLCKLSYLYIVTLIILVHEHLGVLNRYIKSVTKQNGYYICEAFDDKHEKIMGKQRRIDINIETIVFIKRVYWKIWEASRMVENLAKCSLVIGFLNDFFLLFTEIFWFSINLFTQSPIHLMAYLYLILGVVSNFGNMMLLAFNSRKMAQNVSKFISNKLLYDTRQARHKSIIHTIYLHIFRLIFCKQMSIGFQFAFLTIF